MVFFRADGAARFDALIIQTNLARRSSVRLLVIWFLVIFVFFSIPRAKLGSYILPAIPAFSMLAGLGMYRLWSFDARAAKRILGPIFGNHAARQLTAIGIAAIALAGKNPARLVVDASLIATLVWLRSRSYLLDRDRDAKRPGAFVMTLALGILLLIMGVARARERWRGGNLLSAASQCNSHLSAARMHRRIVSANEQSLPFYTGFREALVSYRGELGSFGDEPGRGRKFYQQR